MPDDPHLLYPRLTGLDLTQLVSAERFRLLDKLEAYYRCKQYEAREYDWNGMIRSISTSRDFEPGWYVPMRLRKPATRFDLAKLVVKRLTAMVFGSDRFPQLVIDGDEDAQDYVRQLAKESGLTAVALQLRNKGGAQGSACASFGFVDGKPRISVHNAKHVQILRWADRHQLRPAEVLETYGYPREVFDRTTGKTQVKTFYYARYWDEQTERVWEPIPEEAAKSRSWPHSVPSQGVVHGFGFCPVYWAQNIEESEEVDGESDYEGLCDAFDEINYLQSATNKGTIANVDPTLVIKEDPMLKDDVIRKGSGNAIWSRGGAEYLELRGESLKAALLWLTELKNQVLDTCGVVLADPQMTAKAQSAAAMRMLYLPMINTADQLRETYGRLVVQLMTGMLKAAKAIGTRAPGAIVTTADGHRLQHMPSVLLEDRVVEVDAKPEGKVDPEEAKAKPKLKEKTLKKRVPGKSESVTLNWPPYFPNTWTDTKMATDALNVASGQAQVISQRTAVENAAPMFGVADVDQELDNIAGDTAMRAAQAAAAADSLGAVESKYLGDKNEPKEED